MNAEKPNSARQRAWGAFTGPEDEMIPRSFLDSFIGHAARQAHETALVWHDQKITYGELHRMAGGIAAHIRALELPQSQPVGILARKSPRAIALIIGCLMTGRRFVLPSADLGETTLKALFEQAGCSRILSPDARMRETLPKLAIELIGDGAAAVEPSFGDASDDIGFMLTTSGSTGVPKVVPLPVAAMDSFTDWACVKFGIRPGRTVLNYAPLNFDLCFLDIWATLKGGGCVVLVDQDYAVNGAYLRELLSSIEIHVVQAVPMFYRLLIDAALPNGHRFGCVRHVIFTGDAMPPACLKALPELFPEARFYNIYGCTETNDSFIHEVDPVMAPTGPVPIGQPLPGVDALIIDEEEAVVDGSGVGELLVSTPFQTRGYLGDGLNKGKFSVRGGGASARIYFRSGDLVRRHADGSITLEGRKDFHVKVRGVRVNTEEIERIFLEHGGVLEGAVIALPDPVAGCRLHAVIRRRQGSGLNSLHLFQHCARKLARAAIPSTIIVADEALPKTSTGKIDRRQIRQIHINGETHGL
jgi:acyl-coenzyme A synthetase/AMP-(fatty) acid ligase